MENLEEKRARMLLMVDQWRTSGLSQRIFCIERGVKLATLSSWVAKERDAAKISLILPAGHTRAGNLKKPSTMISREHKKL